MKPRRGHVITLMPPPLTHVDVTRPRIVRIFSVAWFLDPPFRSPDWGCYFEAGARSPPRAFQWILPWRQA